MARTVSLVSVACQDYSEKKVPQDHQEPMASLETRANLVLLGHQALQAYKVPLAWLAKLDLKDHLV